MKVYFNKIILNGFYTFDYVRNGVRKPKFHTFWLWNAWEVRVEKGFVSKNMYIVYMAKIAKIISIFQHLIMWPEVAGMIIFHRKGVFWVYLMLSETILHYKSAFQGDFHIFEKIVFPKFKIWPGKGKSQIFQRIRTICCLRTTHSAEMHFHPEKGGVVI